MDQIDVPDCAVVRVAHSPTARVLRQSCRRQRQTQDAFDDHVGNSGKYSYLESSGQISNQAVCIDSNSRQGNARSAVLAEAAGIVGIDGNPVKTNCPRNSSTQSAFSKNNTGGSETCDSQSVNRRFLRVTKVTSLPLHKSFAIVESTGRVVTYTKPPRDRLIRPVTFTIPEPSRRRDAVRTRIDS